MNPYTPGIRRSRRDCGNLEAAVIADGSAGVKWAAVAATAAILRRMKASSSETANQAAVAATAAILRRITSEFRWNNS